MIAVDCDDLEWDLVVAPRVDAGRCCVLVDSSVCSAIQWPDIREVMISPSQLQFDLSLEMLDHSTKATG